MRTRLLSFSILIAFGAFTVNAQVIHPAAEELSPVLKEKNLQINFANAFPLIASPRVGETAKEVITLTNKMTGYLPGTTKAVGSVSCTTTITNNSTVIKVEGAHYYVHRTQTVKMKPLGCAIDDETSEYLVDGIFPSDVTSEVVKQNIFQIDNISNVLNSWMDWTMAGKNVKLIWSDIEDGFTMVENGTLNLASKNLLCVYSNYLFTAKGLQEGMLVDDMELDVKIDYKETSVATCGAAKPVYGKINADVMSLKINEGTRFCVENPATEEVECDELNNFPDGEFPEQLLPVFPSLSAPLEA